MEHPKQFLDIIAKITFQPYLAMDAVVSQAPIRWRSHNQIDTIIWQLLNELKAIHAINSVELDVLFDKLTGTNLKKEFGQWANETY